MSLRKSLQTFNHTIWAAKNSARLVKGTVNTVRKASRGLREVRRRMVNGPKSDVVARVRRKTRGTLNDKYFNKVTLAGLKRRNQLAATLKAKRNEPIRAAQQKRSKGIVAAVKKATRSIVPPSWIQKGGKSDIDAKSRQINRKHLADFIREARKGPVRGYANRANMFVDFSRKKKKK